MIFKVLEEWEKFFIMRMRFLAVTHFLRVCRCFQLIEKKKTFWNISYEIRVYYIPKMTIKILVNETLFRNPFTL